MDREQCRRLLLPPFTHCLWISTLTPFPLLPTGAVFCLVGSTLFTAFYFMPIFSVDGQAERKTTNTKSRGTTVRMSVLLLHMRYG